MDRIKEVIVVEGKNDTKRIQKTFDVDCFETGGSAISKSLIDQLKELQKKRGLIIFTDPDFPGEKIRKTIINNIPGIKHAFLKRDSAAPAKTKKHSLGVEHASDADLYDAIHNLHVQKEESSAKSNPEITMDDLRNAGLAFDLDAKKRRIMLGEYLHIGYANVKQLNKRLKMFSITKSDFDKSVQKIDENI